MKQIYNEKSDYEKLADAVNHLRQEVQAQAQEAKAQAAKAAAAKLQPEESAARRYAAARPTWRDCLRPAPT